MATETPENWHSRVLEKRAGLFAVLTTVMISIGGLVEIVPMYTVAANRPNTEMVAPYTPLQLAGRDIYVREGCYNCHSQMIRPMRAETMRYGEWSRAAEYAHDRPFQLGSRRIGPDLARIGRKYPDAWHYNHMRDPRSTSPGSVMPPYPWLFTSQVAPDDIAASVRAMTIAGTPYPEMSVADVSASMLEEGGAIVANLAAVDLSAEPLDEIVALIAYMQRLGTDIDAILAAEAGVPLADATPAASPDANQGGAE